MFIKKSRLTFYCFIFVFFGIFSNGYSQVISKKESPQLTRILFLFDASNSMYGQWQSGVKIDIAKKLLGQLLDSLQPIENLQLALRVYGHQKPVTPQDCDDTKLEVPFSNKNALTIKKRLLEINPKGTTPIARSLEASANDFPDKLSRNIVLLITDGIEACDGDPCTISAALQKKGIFLKPFVIGLGLDANYMKAFECIGSVYDASTENGFKNILNVIISQALNATTLQVNLLDINNKANETNLNMTFYDQHSGSVRYNYVHTMNDKGLPDTLKIDPLTTYRIVVHSIPNVTKEDVKITSGKHNVIAIPTPQGSLFLKSEGTSDYKKLACIVKKTAECNSINVQDFNTSEKYIVGKYDLEILSIPRTYLKGIEITQNHTTTVQIPQPGIATISTTNRGFTSLYLEEKSGLTWLVNLDETQTNFTLTLLPGNYRIVYRSRTSKESILTQEKSFKVISGTSSLIKL
jgi:Ca-activated chloride channel family protein